MTFIHNFWKTGILSFIFYTVFFVWNVKASPLHSMIQFEEAEIFSTADQVYPVLRLHGSWQEMGRQYGALAGKQLQEFYGAISADITNRGIDPEEQRIIAKEIVDGYSTELKQLLSGMVETSGLNRDEITIINAGMILLTGAVLSGPPAACSAIVAWDKYTPDGELVFGRNWDIDRKAMKKYMKYLAVVVFNPSIGHSFANIHPLGNVYLETGMNDQGIFIELNNGEAQDNTINEEAEDTSSLLVHILNHAGTLDEASAMLKNTPADLSYILQVADADHAVSVERPTFGTRVRKGKYHGLLAAYNSFVQPYPPSWNKQLSPPAPAGTDPRLNNIWTLANSAAFKGHLNITGMQNLLNITIDDGGSVHPGTVMQVIAIPKTKTVYIRGYDYSDWQKVELAPLFINK